MSNLCILFGEIPFSSKEQADELYTILERRIFIDAFEYDAKKKRLRLDVGFDELKMIDWLEKLVYKKISQALPSKTFARLYFKEGQFFSCVYFTANQYKIVHYKDTAPPSWWKK